jgi:hypothetical protein
MIPHRMADQAAVLAKRLYVNDFPAACPERGQAARIEVRGPGFPKD